MGGEDNISLPTDDFRKERALLSPPVFFWENGEPDAWPPPDDMIDQAVWEHVMGLPTHVALESSGSAGSVVTRLNRLSYGWMCSWPEQEDAPFMAYPTLIAGEEFEALVFNALHGFYRQAIACLRVALENMAIAAALAVTEDSAAFSAWQQGQQEVKYGRARVLLRDSAPGRRIDAAAAPGSVFGDADESWMNSRYKRLCGYAHSRAGYDNGAFWESNGPLYVRAGIDTVEREFRETLALCYLLERLGWPGYVPGPGPSALLSGRHEGWSQYAGVLRSETGLA